MYILTLNLGHINIHFFLPWNSKKKNFCYAIYKSVNKILSEGVKWASEWVCKWKSEFVSDSSNQRHVLRYWFWRFYSISYYAPTFETGCILVLWVPFARLSVPSGFCTQFFWFIWNSLLIPCNETSHEDPNQITRSKVKVTVTINRNSVSEHLKTHCLSD